jgi:hypothetical protein
MRVICPLGPRRSSPFFGQFLRRQGGCRVRFGNYLLGTMDPNDQADLDFQCVYQSFDSVLAGMFARMLEAEGITCRHLGTHFPAEIGVGAMACEQRLEVPAPDASRAQELLASAGALNATGT